MCCRASVTECGTLERFKAHLLAVFCKNVLMPSITSTVDMNMTLPHEMDKFTRHFSHLYICHACTIYASVDFVLLKFLICSKYFCCFFPFLFVFFFWKVEYIQGRPLLWVTFDDFAVLFTDEPNTGQCKAMRYASCGVTLHLFQNKTKKLFGF